jgi:iron complex outermembrane recepter protein
LLPKVARNYRRNADTTLFMSIGSGFKPGGFSAFTGNAALAGFGPERTQTFEGGITWDSPSRAFRSVVRVFYYDIAGYQIERSFATSSATDDYLVVNAARARSIGGELELTWQPLVGLTVAVNLGTTNVTLRDFRDPYTGVNYSGNVAPYVPANDANLRIDYRHRTGWFGGIELGVNGRTYYTEAENLAFGQKSYALVAARCGYTAGRYEVTVYGENLTDRRYYSAITPGTGHGTPGAPRSYGAELRCKF